MNPFLDQFSIASLRSRSFKPRFSFSEQSIPKSHHSIFGFLNINSCSPLFLVATSAWQTVPKSLRNPKDDSHRTAVHFVVDSSIAPRGAIDICMATRF
jgi:hypothetical protein